MRRLSLMLACMLGCAREPWQRAWPATLVPALELRVELLQRADADGARSDVALLARLRWRAQALASSIPGQVEQIPAVWLAPCELDDLTCLREQAESEHELPAVLRELP